MSKLKLQEFLKNHPDDWADILMAPPYNLKIFSKDSRILFKYDQINSDFSNPIVQECRGIVLDRSDWSIVKHPFHKFFNLQESQAATIDWQSAEVMSKEDGCLSEDDTLQTINGRLTVKEIVKKMDNGDIPQILTFNHSTSENEYTDIEEVSIKDNNNDWYEIQIEDNRSIYLTGEHYVWIENLKCYRKVKYLQEGDSVKIA